MGWINIKARVPQESILRPLLFLIYKNDFSIGLNSSIEPFVDDSLILSLIYHKLLLANEFNNDLITVADWTNKMHQTRI